MNQNTIHHDRQCTSISHMTVSACIPTAAVRFGTT